MGATISRQLAPALGYDIGELVICPCSFVPNSTDTPTTLTGDILNSVAYVTTGQWVVTLRDVGYEIVAAVAGAKKNSPTDVTANIGDIDTSAMTIEVNGFSGGSASNTIDRIDLILCLRRKSVARRRA